ncbi:hypothetical protein [Pseudomonas sp. Au-Pse12]|uniref:hypothetical protein n=1 Tax=Pseudomonas sp. Au-Pse12 TaxID=2906459 RepID=UPI001E4D62BE|nr:hypothetical protein [Pseudomonas sp. Au-Pse12]MCE4052329.1 hypothetical protein [Pseudomonas sp. Au-Pse12]
MEEKTYYRASTDFTSGEGIIYTEFFGNIAVRQINIINDTYYSSSCIQDWDKDIGYLLYDGKKDELDLSDSEKITSETFESAWKKSISESDLNSLISYHIGDASIPIHNSTIIIHIVNNHGKWGKGFVLSLSKQYPTTKDSYLSWFKSGFNMGDVQFLSVDGENRIFVANMLAQNGIKKSAKDNNTYICYESLEACLSKISDFALKERLVIQLPMIGAGLGGGNWDTILSIITKKLSYNKIHCHILKLS